MSRENAAAPWRLLEPLTSSGAGQMAMDQALLESARADGFPPTLRFHRWSPPALSIGRFQAVSDIDLEICAAEGIEVVRRPTGGKCILHLDDFTYSIVLPTRFPFPPDVVEAYALLCRGILAALKLLGLDAAMQSREHDDYAAARGACFAAATEADLEYAGRKICGSAQVRRRGALLQHGSILMEDRSELLFRLLRFDTEGQRLGARAAYRDRCVAINDTGRRFTWDEMADSFREGFGEAMGVVVTGRELTAWEEDRAAALLSLYRREDWLVNASRRDMPGLDDPAQPEEGSRALPGGRLPFPEITG